MKKQFTLLLLALLASMTSWASALCDVDFSKIQRWVGEGENKAALVIQWNDGKDDNRMLVWGYRWKAGESKTGADMVLDIAKADPSLTVCASTGGFGLYITGFGYDINQDGTVCFLDNSGNMTYPRRGRIGGGTPIDDGDHWQNGFSTSGYFAYGLGTVGSDYEYSGVGCSSRKLTDKCVDLWTYGSGAINTSEMYYLPETFDYTKGAFVVNENRFGHRNSAVTFLSNDGKWNYKAVEDVGCTACFGTFYGNKFYAIAKQAKDKSASVTGGRITICNGTTMGIVNQIENIDAAKGADGRSFLGVDEHKAYVSTSNGIYVLDLNSGEITGEVTMDGNSIVGQCGNMVRKDDRVYAVSFSKGICVINPETNEVENVISGSFGSIVMSKDGNLWVSLFQDRAYAGLAKLNLEEEKVEKLSLPEGIGNPVCTYVWGAWTPDALCASAKENALYWTSVSGWSTYMVFKYDIDQQKFTKFIDLSAEEGNTWSIYGCSFRIDPVTDNAYTTLAVGYTNNYKVRKYDNKGNLLAEYAMEPDVDASERNYWYPGMFVFPDTEDPVWNKLAQQTVEVGSTVTIDLAGQVTDADNMDAAIVKSISKVSNDNVVATMNGSKLVIEGKKAGNTTITLKANSNGIIATTTLSVKVDEATGISNVENTSNVYEVARYTVDGKRIAAPQKGINIVRMSDGSTRKVVVK